MKPSLLPESPPFAALQARLSALDTAALRAEFEANAEFIAIPDFLSADDIAPMVNALPVLEARVHRNFIPGHKKGGSISRYDLDASAPAFPEFYRSPAFRSFLEALCGRPLLECPADDPHTYALYYYTEAGDHIGWHYDTSYYKGARYTVLLGLVDESSCRLEYELHRDDPQRASVSGGTALTPGMLVVFNGDKLWHRVTPAAAGERRVALTLEYVTTLGMHPLRRFVSNMKDAIAYFGFRQVFSGVKRS
ncbi:MAG: 2OG-Fe(II) oxygenase [Proteobacteria bacterium]|nr:2OG-Fe(II) oxygenase [Pseudomonadota bacterium]